MDWIILVIAFILGAISMFMMVCIGHAAKQEEPKNRVHFYVARDKDGSLWLYMGKPTRTDDKFASSINIVLRSPNKFRYLGLNENDYSNLKWEDEPVEVFINMED